MRFVLNGVYLLLLLALSPWLLYAAIRKGKYRRGWGAKWWGGVPARKSQRRCVWLHAVSVGEVNLLAPVIAGLETTSPEIDIVISTTTQTGYELACRKYAPRSVFYCPLDFSWAVHRALQRISPDLLVLAELEIWPNLVHMAHRRGVKIGILNGRLSDRSWRGYRWIRPLIARVLKKIDWIGAQTEQTAQRFVDLGARPECVEFTGSIKFDGAELDRGNPATRQLAEAAGIADSDRILLAGSTQAPEEAIVIDVFRSLRSQFSGLRLIVTPRHPERFGEVVRLLEQSGLRWARRSHLRETEEFDWQVLLVDAVGELRDWWGTAEVGFVGGSFGSRGGQNMIEPAGYGAAVCFGPNTWNFRDVVRLFLQREAAVVVSGRDELEAFARRCLEQPEWARELGGRARSLVAEQQGATARTVHRLGQLMPEVAERIRRADASQGPRPPAKPNAAPPKQVSANR